MEKTTQETHNLNSSSVHGSQVFSTREYTMFKIDPKNRPVDEKHLQNLVEEITRKNLLSSYPILTEEDGTVLDGQHRLKAAETLNVPIYYMITDGMTIDDVAIANAYNLDWSYDDALHHYVQMKNKEYIRLKEFCDRYEWITVAAAAYVCNTTAGGGAGKKKMTFLQGRYEIKTLEFAEKVARTCIRLSEFGDFTMTTTFLAVMNSVMKNKGFDLKKFISKLEYRQRSFVKCHSQSEYIAMIEEIYNYNVRVDNRVFFRKRIY